MIPRCLAFVGVALAAVVASRQLGCAMPLKSHNRIHLLLAVVAVASLIALVIFATTEPVIADQDPRAVGASTLVPQSAPYFGKVTDIRISSDPVYQGWATIFVHVQNRSSAGEAIFDVRLEVDPPGFNNTVYPADTDNSWDNVWFSANGTVILSKTYNFAQTTGAFSRYRLKAEVYNINGKQNNWRSNDRYDDATRQEDFEVSAASYDASVTDLEISRDTVRQGDTATISAEFTNEVRSSSGDGTFDIAFEIDPPGGNNTVELEFTGSSRNFTGNQSKVLRKTYRFQHRGVHIIKARIWNPDRSTLFDESETRVDVETPYAAEVTDIRISPSRVYQGQATINVVVRNRSSVNGPERGAATFDVRLEVDPPGGGNTVYPADTGNNWDNVRFSANGTVTLSKTYNFAQTTGAFSRYRLKAEVYNINGKQNNWRSNDRYDDATRQEDFEVSAVSYDASVRDLEISRDTIRQGDTATISAEFTNEVRSNSGDGTFDIAFVVDPPGANNTVELEFTGSSRNFTGNQSKALRKSYRFQQRGVHIIKARIWNPDRSTLFDESETRVDVETPYAAEVTDIRISPSRVHQGQATINVVVRNRSSVNGPERGAATFDVRLEVDPPGGNNTVYPADTDNSWAAVSFSANGTVTLSKTYNFAQTTGAFSRYRLKAEVYGSGGKQNDWPSDYLFDDATREENFEVLAALDLPSHEFEAGVTRVFPLGGMHVGQRTKVNVDWSVLLDDSVRGTGPTFGLSAAFYPQDSDVPMPGAASDPYTVAVGDRKSTLLNFPAPSEPGDYRICARIGPPGLSSAILSSDFDADSTNDSACTDVRVLPYLGDDFSEGFVAFPFRDNRNEHYWVYAPEAYTEPKKVSEALDERTWGGFEHRNDRKELYRQLGLDIARRGQTIGGRIILVHVPDDQKKELLTEFSTRSHDIATEFEPVKLAAEPVIENAEHLVGHLMVANHLSPDHADTLFSHMGHASKAATAANLVFNYGPILLDVIASESVNRTIEVEDAKKILVALESLPMGDAWQEAIEKVREDIEAMTSPDGMTRWWKAVEDHLDELL